MVQPVLTLGRYTLFDALGHGGMASVHVARQTGGLGFNRIVAVKRLHPQLASASEFVAMFLDEARLAARIRDTHVVETVDLIEHGGEILIVMEYVEGCSLSALLKAARRAGERVPQPVVASIVGGLLRGLHAAHVAIDRDGTPLSVVHRDVSPHNVLVGVDGIARVLDFGVAKANGRLQSTRDGQLKGKIAYMAPEQLRDGATIASDVYAAGVVLFEALAGRRPYEAESETALMMKILDGMAPRLDDIDPTIPSALATVVERAMAMEPAARFASAAEMADTLARACEAAPPADVAATLKRLARNELAHQRALVERVEQHARDFDYDAVSGILETKTRRTTTTTPARLAPTRPVTLALASARDRSAATETAVPRKTQPHGSRLRPALAAVAVGSVVALVAVRAFQTTPTSLIAGKAAIHAPALPIAAATEAPNPTPTSLAGAASSSAPSSAEPSGIATSSAASQAHQTAPPAWPTTARPATGSGAAASTATTTQPTGQAAPGPDCDPPYFIDDRGIQRVKRGCLKAAP